MILILVGISIAEGVVLVAGVVALLHLHRRVRHLDDPARGAVAQMRDWVFEVADLTSALAVQLSQGPRVTGITAGGSASQRLSMPQPPASQTPAPAVSPDSHRVVLRFADTADGGRSGLMHAQTAPVETTGVKPVIRLRGAAAVENSKPTDEGRPEYALERRTAPARKRAATAIPEHGSDRGKVMDPVGLAVQRLLAGQESGIA
jgi:hypothetical protein